MKEKDVEDWGQAENFELEDEGEAENEGATGQQEQQWEEKGANWEAQKSDQYYRKEEEEKWKRRKAVRQVGPRMQTLILSLAFRPYIAKLCNLRNQLSSKARNIQSLCPSPGKCSELYLTRQIISLP